MIIGISPRLTRNDSNTTFVQISKNYFQALLDQQLTPLIIPYQNYQEVLMLCHGFLIGGGEDINPAYYGEENNGSVGIDKQLDQIDLAIVNYASNYNLPLLGICRGFQAIVVFLGGSLIQDLNGLNAKHHQKHFVRCCNETNFTKTLPTTFLVNSSHHQAIKNLPNTLRPIYECDNIIEAVEHYTKPIIGFQWHPERLNNSESTTIFKYFKKLVIKMHELKDSKLIYNGKIVKLSLNRYLLPNGKLADREIIKHNGGVGILTIVDKIVYFVKQHRHAINQDILEIPAGCIEPNEDPLISANRELQEEIGFEATNLTFLGSFYPTCGYSSEIIHLYLATQVIKHSEEKDEDEFIEIVKIPLANIDKMIDNHEITDGKTLLALLLYKNRMQTES